MEEMKCPEPKVTDRNETPKTSAARKRPGSWLQENALKGQTAHSPGQSEATPWVKGAHRLNIAL